MKFQPGEHSHRDLTLSILLCAAAIICHGMDGFLILQYIIGPICLALGVTGLYLFIEDTVEF